MPTEAHDTPLSSRSTGSVPRAVWVGGGLLSLVTAALAGALIMRSVEPAPIAPTVVGSTTSAAGTPLVTPVTAPPIPTAPSPAARPPEHHAKARTAPARAAQPAWNPPGGSTRAALCANCGVVESVSQIQRKGQGTGLGVVAGGLLGGVVGHQVGGGNGKTAMTVLGAIGGGLAGNEVEKRARGETVFDVRVRMEDGNTRTFQRSQSLAVGTHVVAEGTALRIVRDTAGNDEPRTVRTSAPADART